MSVTLSIKQVPDDVAEKLRQRAARNHRSLQRELLALVEQAVGGRQAGDSAAQVLQAREAEPGYAMPDGVEVQAVDSLLSELDAIVAGSRFGIAPLLTREQMHDRALARELEFDSRNAESSKR